MEYNYIKAEKSTVKLTITLNEAEWEQAQVEAYNKTKGKYAMQGFRKGKVPMKVLENAYGKGIFFEDAVNGAFPKYYFEILDKEPSILAISEPSLELGDSQETGITFVAIIPVKPEVKIGAYKGINIGKIEYNVTDEDIESELKKLQERNSRLVNVEDRASENGDTIIIDYSGSVGGVKFDGGTAEKQTLVLGSNSFIPGFEEQCVGMNLNEEKDINVKFPDEYQAENLKGKDAIFHIVLHEIKTKELPAINNEFIKEADGSETLAIYKEKTRENLQKANDAKAKNELDDKIIKAVTANAETEIPDALVDNQVEHMVKEMEYRFMYQGLKLEDYLKYTKQTLEDYKKGFVDQAAVIVKEQLVIDKIITDENIVATDEEVEAKVAEMAKKQNKEVPDFKKNMEAKQLDYIKNEIVIEKLFTFLKSENKIN